MEIIPYICINQTQTMTLTVIDLEVNKEFNLISIDLEKSTAVIQNPQFGFCSQQLSKLKFTNNQIESND